MDGSFIRAGSGSAGKERAAVCFKHERHNEHQLGPLIKRLLSGMGRETNVGANTRRFSVLHVSVSVLHP